MRPHVQEEGTTMDEAQLPRRMAYNDCHCGNVKFWKRFALAIAESMDIQFDNGQSASHVEDPAYENTIIINLIVCGFVMINSDSG